jgi:secreted PhoX family phosphatase
MTGIDRRLFLRRSAAASGLLLAPSLTGLIACTADRPLEPSGTALPPLKRAGRGQGGYGELIPSRDVDGIISIPRGFRAARLSTAGEEMIGGAVPNAFDGMAAFAAGPNLVRLIRNHELRDTPEFGTRAFAGEAYDDKGPAGNTTVEVRVYPSGKAELVKQFASLSGTSTNCAGGSTPWRTWISSEETTMGGRAGFDRAHGYNFEVEVDNNGLTRAVPLREMGRFDHEAVAVDPQSGFVYQTEDRTPSGFYRFKPKTYGRLRDGGELQILAIEGKPQYNTSTG